MASSMQSKFWSGPATLISTTEKVSYSMIVPTRLQSDFKNHFNSHDYPKNSVILGSHEFVRCVVASFTVEFWYRPNAKPGPYQVRISALNERSGDLETFDDAIKWLEDAIHYFRNS